MAILEYSVRAARDLNEIAEYTARRWGAEQAVAYLDRLKRCCQNLTVLPDLGRSCEDVRAGLRRLESGSHVVFYRTAAQKVLVVRILHRSMLPRRWVAGDTPE